GQGALRRAGGDQPAHRQRGARGQPRRLRHLQQAAVYDRMGVGDAQQRLIELVSVNVGVPRRIGVHAGRAVRSAIGKTPVTSVDELELTVTQLEGDRQADLRVHGGPEKALFVYSAETLQAWSAEYGQTFPPGLVGENLTVGGADEDSVHIGDVWRWGAATVQVCQPRSP